MVSKYEKTGNKESGTIYSNVYDLRRGEVDIYYKRDFENPIKFSLKNEIKKGNPTCKLNALFKK